MTAQNVHDRTELAKETLCNYIKEHKDITAPELCKALGMTKNQVTHYLKFLHERGYIVKMVQRQRTKRFAVYNIGRTPFSKKPKPTVENVVDKTVHIPHARVVKLTDRHYLRESAPKKRTSVANSIHIGSSMSLFGNW